MYIIPYHNQIESNISDTYVNILICKKKKKNEKHCFLIDLIDIFLNKNDKDIMLTK